MRKYILLRIISLIGAIIILAEGLPASAENREYTFCEVLIEASGGVVIEGKNENAQVPVGTMAKLMTVLLAAEQVNTGKFSLEDKLKTSQHANSMQGAQIWLMPGEEITADELFKAVIIGNANDAAVVLAEKVSTTEEEFVKVMNVRARELGMKNTVFNNCNGYYNDGEQVSTAYDLALLCMELAKYDFLRDYFTCWRDFVRDGAAELVNANDAVRGYKGLIGFKAGYTENAGNCVALGAERDGVTYISVVLGSGDKGACIGEAKRLLTAGFSQYTVFVPEKPKDIPAEIKVRGGLTGSVPVECGEVRSVVLPNGAAGSVTARVVMPEYVYAPVNVGQKVGEVQFLRNDRVMFAVDVYTTDAAEKMTVQKALCIIIKKLLTF